MLPHRVWGAGRCLPLEFAFTIDRGKGGAEPHSSETRGAGEGLQPRSVGKVLGGRRQQLKHEIRSTKPERTPKSRKRNVEKDTRAFLADTRFDVSSFSFRNSCFVLRISGGAGLLLLDP